MRCRRMEAPAVAEDVSATEWRRHPAKPATELIVSTNPSLRPDEPYPPTATQISSYNIHHQKRCLPALRAGRRRFSVVGRGVKATDMLLLVLTPEDVVTMRAAGPASCVYRTGADIVRCNDGR